MAKVRELISNNGKAVFYATIYPELKEAALDCGWALGLHGSMASDMDIMAMPWDYRVDTISKPNNRAVITIWIFADFYLDINVIKPFKISEDCKNPFYKKLTL
jgi:hypothetical protein